MKTLEGKCSVYIEKNKHLSWYCNHNNTSHMYIHMVYIYIIYITYIFLYTYIQSHTYIVIYWWKLKLLRIFNNLNFLFWFLKVNISVSSCEINVKKLSQFGKKKAQKIVMFYLPDHFNLHIISWHVQAMKKVHFSWDVRIHLKHTYMSIQRLTTPYVYLNVNSFNSTSNIL